MLNSVKLLKFLVVVIIVIVFGTIFYMYGKKNDSIDENLVVRIQQGLLKGQERKSTLNKTKYYAFKGIPYGKPPVGSLRFKDPEPAESWDGIFDGLNKDKRCLQVNRLGQKVGSEDCLYLNIYTPDFLEKTDKKFPVMVWFHAGGFTFGSGNENLQGAGLLIEHGVVIVTLEYRLGVFGFLNTLNKNAPGNAGLKDQVLALKWIKNNINSFGGDPSKVTIFGSSAGSASAQYHTLSPLSRGLFHGIILESGSVLNPWAFTEQPKYQAFRLGKILGFNGTSEDNLGQYLLSIPAEELMWAQHKIINYGDPKQCLDFPFLPSVEMEGTGNNFLTEHPRILLKRGEFTHVPAIIGHNSNEGIIFLSFHSLTVKRTYEQFIPEQLHLVCGSKKYKELTNEIKTLFFHDNPVDINHLAEYIQICGDIAFDIGINETINYFLNHSDSDIYIYEFNFDGILGRFKPSIQKMESDWKVPNGVSHGDELTYIFPRNDTETIDVNSPELRTIQRMTRMWTNFAKTRSPNGIDTKEVFWEPASKQKMRVLNIGEHLKLMKTIISLDRMKLWGNVFKKYTNENP
ncbi:juvenile hormone esterase-like isoform X2 [Lycorma delicatula]|uniref:juvenile hormone esterase-like isoform X2 n=1 Tax=Lycorma delicatula TaxID=130591 RepID=UPI003F514392